MWNFSGIFIKIDEKIYYTASEKMLVRTFVADEPNRCIERISNLLDTRTN